MTCHPLDDLPCNDPSVICRVNALTGWECWPSGQKHCYHTDLKYPLKNHQVKAWTCRVVKYINKAIKRG